MASGGPKGIQRMIKKIYKYVYIKEVRPDKNLIFDGKC